MRYCRTSRRNPSRRKGGSLPSSLARADKIRSVRLGDGWTFTTYDMGITRYAGDWREAIGWCFRHNGLVMACSRDKWEAFVPSPLHSADSDESTAAAASLALHSLAYDEDDRRVSDPPFDIRHVENLVSYRFPDL